MITGTSESLQSLCDYGSSSDENAPLDSAWKNLCKTKMMEKSFRDVGLSLHIDGSEDHLMKFQGQPAVRPKVDSNLLIFIVYKKHYLEEKRRRYI